MAVKDQLITERYAVHRGDCVEVMKGYPDRCVDLSCYSPPFGGMLYQYSSDPADLSNSKDYDEFFAHYAFVVREIHRLTKPGRMTAVHCCDIMAGMGDRPHLIDFPGDIVRCHESNGWKYIARYHVWKEPLMVRNRTMVKSLHHKTLCEDSTRCSVANADYLLVFRRDGKNEIPVAHPTGLMSYAGSRQPPEDLLKWRGHKGPQIENEYSHWVWRQYASAFWDDVRIDRTLGSGAGLYSANKADKDEPDEKHMHPLQLDVIERAVVMWSNPNETLLTPFMGIGSEVYGALINGRRGIGIELKVAYYRQAITNLATAISADDQASAKGVDDRPVTQGSILDLLDEPGPKTQQPAPDLPTWRNLTLEAAGYTGNGEDAWSEEIATPILDAGVKTCGELADRLVDGERFGIVHSDLQPVYEAIELRAPRKRISRPTAEPAEPAKKAKGKGRKAKSK